MARHDRTLERILKGGSDANLAFRDVQGLLRNLGFDERVRGDHYIFSRDGVQEILNLQPKAGMAKPYQIKQIRNVLIKYRLGASNG